MGKKAFGEQNPNQGEDAVSWQTWSDGSASVPTITGDSNWGKLKLDLSGEEGRSAVYDLGSVVARTYSLTENRYGTGTGSALLQIRGSETSFTQDSDTPAWENYFNSITRSWRYVQIKETTVGRLVMWVWPEDYQTKANADAIISFSTNRVTDLYLMAMDYNASPCVWLGNATLGDVTATQVEGVTPFTYMLNAGHAAGIRVHAWLWMCDFDFWGSTTGLITPDVPNNGTYNDAGIWNFHSATARTKLSDVIADFVTENPGIDGLNFDFEATTANITSSDMTSFLTELHGNATQVEFSACTGASIYADTALKIDMPTWITNNLINTISTMGYYDCNEIKSQYVNSTGIYKKYILAGIGAEDYNVNPSDFRHKWKLMENDGYTSFAIFCWANDIKDNVNLRNAVDEWLSHSLVTTQSPITKVTVTPGTSFSLTVNGSDQTTTYASVSSHTTAGPLKAYVESAIGSLNPAVLYWRAGSTATAIVIGDYEP